ncbi:thermonuclease family protein [Ancylobacter oerskovii]|uniref:Thermonuclease family protein n=1 Tax=Ancylobacter oerskovii TaxID=459519 RepID=A0ABW4Z2R0_9HYPH|nr:thermonuclease family protein [Ancylobacter oerskovii]
MLKALALLILLGTSAAAEPLSGQATVIDGDTLEIHGERIRLNGIDAPESRQTCRRADGASYRCGQVAAFALADLIGRATASCEPTGRDRYKRIIATCAVGGTDVGQWMVEQGHAMAFRRYSEVYVPEEIEASRTRRGIWQGPFLPPWAWRAQAGESAPRHGQ